MKIQTDLFYIFVFINVFKVVNVKHHISDFPTLAMFGRTTTTFDRLLEKSTSQLLLEPDWTSIMMLCDSIRQGDVNPKYAVAAIKKKFYHTNPHVALYARQVKIYL